jgi:hypothetical protein
MTSLIVQQLMNILKIASSVNGIKLKRMRWAGNVVHTRFRWGNLGRKISLGRSRPRLEDNIRMDLKSVGNGVDWLDLARGTGN